MKLNEGMKFGLFVGLIVAIILSARAVERGFPFGIPNSGGGHLTILIVSMVFFGFLGYLVSKLAKPIKGEQKQ